MATSVTSLTYVFCDTVLTRSMSVVFEDTGSGIPISSIETNPSCSALVAVLLVVAVGNMSIVQVAASKAEVNRIERSLLPALLAQRRVDTCVARVSWPIPRPTRTVMSMKAMPFTTGRQLEPSFSQGERARESMM